jgi:hypothetical protein
MITSLITTVDPLALAPLVWALAGLFVTRRLGDHETEEPRVVPEADRTVLRPAA